jgi:hypothetical protein
VYVNKKLALNLGGVHGAQSGGIDLDTLGLVAGLTYSLDLFHAERHTSESNFSFTTSAVLRDDVPGAVPIPPAVALFGSGLGLLGLLAARRRKKHAA